ncbi:hypothetical protein SAY87_008277 [Trapa incisa]|uniref:Uncharacterized protein n=1 Tax=Trapa incisa TaxID=236973 RepID=A0AAN7KGV8_9MYRT|nr:hypothetical protein SAY87_008277 [Trapa incisa]
MDVVCSRFLQRGRQLLLTLTGPPMGGKVLETRDFLNPSSDLLQAPLPSDGWTGDQVASTLGAYLQKEGMAGRTKTTLLFVVKGYEYKSRSTRNTK